MNRTKLKNYAPQARRDFIQAMTDRAAFYGMTATKIEPVVEKGDVAVIAGREYPRAVAAKRNKLADRVAQHGFLQTMEALAYTWFNRLVAIRYMELHGYLDHGYRVLSHPMGKPTPEIFEHAEHVDLPGLKKGTVIDLKLAGNKEAELYRLLLLAQCNVLQQAMPFLFEPLDDETELLLPDNLLHTDSLIRKLVAAIDKDDCESVEVLGWLYQFYIADRKDVVMARKSAVPKEDIPAVTQLFTPHWIVRYLVENSLGRLWLLNRPGSRLREHMPYYIEGEPETEFLKIAKPEEIRLLDPAVGSGHMLTYAFDLLTVIYQEEGYTPTEIPALILRHNLYGLDICPRAAQLAGLALVFKAREKSRRFFRPEFLVQPNIIELREVRFADNELRDYIDALGLGDLFNQPMLTLLHQFEEAKNFGSLIQPCLNEQNIAFARRAIEAKDLGGQIFLRETHLKVLRVLEQAETLTQRYQVVVANPPYMGNKAQPTVLKQLLEQCFASGKSDLFAAFVLRTFSLALPHGHLGLMTPFTWMFITTYAEFRRNMLQEAWIQALIQPEYHSFFESAFVPICCFVIRRVRSDAPGIFIDLSAHYGGDIQSDKALEAIRDPKCAWRHHVAARSFLAIPDSPIAFTLSPKIVNVFGAFSSLGELVPVKEGLNTGNNERFLRFWQEVSHNQICLHPASSTDCRAESFRIRWFPCNKGGPFRRWYGNNEYIIDWKDDGLGMRELRDANGKQLAALRNLHFLFKQGLTWSGVSLAGFSAREFPVGFAFNSAGRSLFTTETNHKWLLGALNSVVCFKVLQVLAPTMSVTVGVVASLPIPPQNETMLSVLTPVVDEASSLMRADWDSFETSWDFRDQPLLRPGLKAATIEASWRNWEAHSTAAIRRMQQLETENNRLFIAAYGLEGELQPEVPEEQITLARPGAGRNMAALLSYAIGCMMGRYSLDKPGLIYAHGGSRDFDPSQYRTFPADPDGIMPLLESDWGFPDDTTTRVVEFIGVAWPKEHLEANLKFIADSLGPSDSDQPRETIRRYLATGFYRNHLQIYKRRPIYWLFSSGKQRAFQCLVYLHRYHEGTLARMRTEYVIPLQGKLVSRIEQLEGDKTKATSTSHGKKLQREQDDLKKQQAELRAFDEKLKHYADQKISLDLDDGVKLNYGKFGDLLAEVKAVCGAKEEE